MNHLARLGEVAVYGYAWKGDHYCDRCMHEPDDEEPQFISSSEETDSPMHCCICGALIPGSLTSEGVTFVRLAWARNPKGEAEQLWREEFDWTFPYEEEPVFDRFDVCEAWYQYAHDYGVYEVIGRLQRMRFKPRPSLSVRSLNSNAFAIYCRLAGA